MNFLDLRKFLRLTVLVLTYFDSVMGYLNWVNFGVYRGWKIILIRSIIIKQHFCDREIRVRGWKRNWISRVMQSISWKSFNIIKLKTDAWQAEYIFIMIFTYFSYSFLKITILVFGRSDKYATKTVKIRFQNSKKQFYLTQKHFFALFFRIQWVTWSWISKWICQVRKTIRYAFTSRDYLFLKGHGPKDLSKAYRVHPCCWSWGVQH